MKRLRLSGLLLLILCLSLLAIPFWNDRIVRRYIDKIWLHRTNSIEKLHEFEQEYKILSATCCSSPIQQHSR